MRVSLVGCDGDPLACPFRDFGDAVVFGPWVEARPGHGLVARGAVDLRLHPTPSSPTLDELGQAAIVQPVSLKLRDAWVGTQGEVLDVFMGARRITWGTALGFSVADELQPYDLEDPTHFDRRLPSPGLSATLHRGPWSLEGAVLPIFTPALLPTGLVDLTAGADELFDGEATGAGDVTLNEVELRPTLPPNSLGEVTLGGRLRWTPELADVAVSWVHGRDSLPQVDGEVVLTGFQTDTDRVDVGVPVSYPHRYVGALEFRATPWGEVGLWGELAVVLPDRTTATTSERQLEALAQLGTIEEVPDPLPVTITQDGAPYARWILGTDRALGPVHLVAQWLHGFPTERQASDLSDYGIVGLRWSPSPAIRTGLTGLSDGAGLLVDAEVGTLVRDNLELALGGTYVVGPEGSALRDFRGLGHARLSGELHF